MPLLDENPNTPARMRRFNQILARLLNRGIIAGAGLRATEGVLRVAQGRSIFVPPAGDGCLTESPACLLDTVEVDVFEDGGLEHAGDTAVSPARDRLRVKAFFGLATDSNGLNIDRAANSGLAFAGQKILVAAGDGIAVGNQVDVDLATDPGLQFQSGALRVKVKAGGGVTRDADGLSVSAGVASDLFDAYDSAGGQTVNGTPIILNIDMNDVNTDGAVFALAADVVTITPAGKGKFTVTVCVASSVAANDFNFDFVVRRNGTPIERTRTPGGAGSI